MARARRCRTFSSSKTISRIHGSSGSSRTIAARTAILSAANRLIANNPRRHPKKLWSPRPGRRVGSCHFGARRPHGSRIRDAGGRRALRGWKRPYEQVAVIYRMNAQSRLLEENFRRSRIPYRLVGGRSFFERREIKDLTAYMTVLLNPSDDASLLRIINTPPRGIGATTVELALDIQRGKQAQPLRGSATLRLSGRLHAQDGRRHPHIC